MPDRMIEIAAMTDIVEKAAAYAVLAHGDQKRKYTGEPYTNHTSEVAGILKEYDFADEVIAAAHLHDTIEDTEVTYNDLLNLFGETVADLVLEVSNVSRPEHGNRDLRKTLDRQYLAGASSLGQSIKYADMISNTASIVEHDPGFAIYYLKEKAKLMRVMTRGYQPLYDRCMQQLNECVVKLDVRI
jgi:(p)ppGpp synthase/HD superfamily hydrolase